MITTPFFTAENAELSAASACHVLTSVDSLHWVMTPWAQFHIGVPFESFSQLFIDRDWLWHIHVDTKVLLEPKSGNSVSAIKDCTTLLPFSSSEELGSAVSAVV